VAPFSDTVYYSLIAATCADLTGHDEGIKASNMPIVALFQCVNRLGVTDAAQSKYS